MCNMYLSHDFTFPTKLYIYTLDYIILYSNSKQRGKNISLQMSATKQKFDETDKVKESC